MVGEDCIGNWLVQEKTKSMLARIAKSVEIWLRAKQVHPSFLASLEHGAPGHGPENFSDRIDEIRSELQCFILEKGPEFHAMILAGQDGTDRLIRNAFQNHLLDGVRKVGVDPRRYFYKRAAQVLRQADQFHTDLKSGRFVTFSLKADSANRPPLTEEELKSISYPVQLGLDFQKLCGREALELLAGHFWRESAGLRGADIRVDLRDYVDWVFLHVEPPGIALDDGDAGAGGLIENSAASEEEGAEHTAGPEDALDAAEIRRLAACFAGRLEPGMKAVMYYRDALGLSWNDIAGHTGHRGPSGPVYTYKAARGRMEAFIRDQRKLSPEDFDLQDYQLFYETLLQILKEFVAEP